MRNNEYGPSTPPLSPIKATMQPRRPGQGQGRGGSAGRRPLPQQDGPRPSSAVVRFTKRMNHECAERGDVRGARDLLQQMMSKGISPTLVTANTLLKCYRNARQPEGAERVLLEMREWGIAPDGCSYCTVIDAYGLAGKVGDAHRMLQQVEASGLRDSRAYSAILRHVHPTEVFPIFERLVGRGISYDQLTCLAALNTLASSGFLQQVLDFMGRFMGPGSAVQPDGCAYETLIKAHCAAGQLQDAEALLGKMVSQGSRKNLATVSTLMNAYVSLRPPNMEAATRLMNESFQRGLRPDTAMFNVLIKGYSSLVPPQPKAAEAIIEEICALGLQPSTASICSVMDAWCMNNQVDEARRVAERYAADSAHVFRSEVMFNVLMKGYARCRCKACHGYCNCDPCGCCQPEKGLELLEEMAKCGLKPDIVTINTLIDTLCCAGQLPRACSLLESLLVRRSVSSAGGGALQMAANLGGGDGTWGAAERSVPLFCSHFTVTPDVATFSTLFRAMLKRVSKRFSTDRISSSEADGQSLERVQVLEMMIQCVCMMSSCRTPLDPSLIGTLSALCQALGVDGTWAVDVMGGTTSAHPATLSSAACAAAIGELESSLRQAAQMAHDAHAWLPHGLMEENGADAKAKCGECGGDCCGGGDKCSMARCSSARAAPAHRKKGELDGLSRAPSREHAEQGALGARKSERATAAHAPMQHVETAVVPSQLHLPGMVCSGCATVARNALSKVAGVSKVEVDLETKIASVWGTGVIPSLLAAVAAAGQPGELIHVQRTPSDGSSYVQRTPSDVSSYVQRTPSDASSFNETERSESSPDNSLARGKGSAYGGSNPREGAMDGTGSSRGTIDFPIWEAMDGSRRGKAAPNSSKEMSMDGSCRGSMDGSCRGSMDGSCRGEMDSSRRGKAAPMAQPASPIHPSTQALDSLSLGGGVSGGVGRGVGRSLSGAERVELLQLRQRVAELEERGA